MKRVRATDTVHRVSVYFRSRDSALEFASRMTQEGRRVGVRFNERRPAKVGSGRKAA